MPDFVKDALIQNSLMDPFNAFYVCTLFSHASKLCLTYLQSEHFTVVAESPRLTLLLQGLYGYLAIFKY